MFVGWVYNYSSRFFFSFSFSCLSSFILFLVSKELFSANKSPILLKPDPAYYSEQRSTCIPTD